MKTIIAGGRDYEFRDDDVTWLDALKDQIPITEVVSGCARGADTCGEQWAASCSIPVKRFPADWERLGRRAGPIRNGQMAEYADVLIAFPGGRGTANMMSQAALKGMKIFRRDSHDAFKMIMDANNWIVRGESGPAIDMSALKDLGPVFDPEEASDAIFSAMIVRRLRKKDPKAAEEQHRQFLARFTVKQLTSYLRALRRDD